MRRCDRESGAAANHIALRPAQRVMSPEHAAVSVANALSFPRATMREMLRDRYRIEKLRFELDAQGRGEVLYRIVAGDWTFHFFLVADLLPEEAKTDRNFAQGWDAMGVLCQGDWTPEREALLRREVPRQRAGYADYDTLMYARGNRSARVFDHVVESLAAGGQPDPKILAPVGYILRTTAFIGNGQLGTRPLAGFEPGHPLRRPYHAQFCSAFALREYVFDLADHLARVRNPGAARLSPAMRRYIGLGNSAATGLTAFAFNHPHFMHSWTLAVEQAHAKVGAKPVGRRDPVLDRCLELLDKAVRYYREGAKEGDGVFLTPQSIAGELHQVRDRLESYRSGPGPDIGATWQALSDELLEDTGAETREVLSSILLELYPDVADAQMDAFQADERCEVQASMTAGELLALLERDYGWAIELSRDASATRCFWYRCSSAPRDIRRAMRGRVPGYETETNMDRVAGRTLARLSAAGSRRHVRGARSMRAAGLAAHCSACAVAGRHGVCRDAPSLPGGGFLAVRVHPLRLDVLRHGEVRCRQAQVGAGHIHAGRPDSRGRCARPRRRLAVSLDAESVAGCGRPCALP